MTEENTDYAVPEGSGMETNLSQEQVDILKKAIEEAASNTVNQQYSDPVSQQASNTETPPRSKYPSDTFCRCKMTFFLQNGMEYQNEINITMDRIEMIQNQMTSSLENRDGMGVIYLEGSKNSPADFTAIPVKNIIYMKFEIQDSKKI